MGFTASSFPERADTILFRYGTAAADGLPANALFLSAGEYERITSFFKMQ